MQGRLVSKPSLLREALDEKGVEVRSKNQSVLPTSSPYTWDTNASLAERNPFVASLGEDCTCRPMKSGQRWTLIASLTAASITASKHRKDCALWRSSDAERSLGLEFSWKSYILKRSIQATWCITFGAGSFSIGPSLTLRGIRRSNAPQFLLVEEFGWQKAITTSDLIGNANKFLEQVYRLFQSGLGSLYEVDNEGNTLLIVRATCWTICN